MALQASGSPTAEAGSGTAIRGQERAGYGPAATASAVCYPGLQLEAMGALLGLESGKGGGGKEREEGGGRSKANTALWGQTP